MSLFYFHSLWQFVQRLITSPLTPSSAPPLIGIPNYAVGFFLPSICWLALVLLTFPPLIYILKLVSGFVIPSINFFTQFLLSFTCILRIFFPIDHFIIDVVVFFIVGACWWVHGLKLPASRVDIVIELVALSVCVFIDAVKFVYFSQLWLPLRVLF